MDLNRYFITINPVGLATAAEQRKYVAQVHEHLRWIYRTTSGRILLNCIRRPEFPVEIRPYTGADCNAVGGSELKPGAAALTGFVAYSPSTFGSHGACSTLPGGQTSGRLFDEILFHELIHVFRTATGRWNQGRTLSFSMAHYDDNEEFIAVLCANIYVSDRTNRIKSGLRAGHQGYGAMSPADAARFGLFASSKNAFSLVKGFCDDNPIFTKAISTQLKDVIYNPIADYYQHPRICEMLSLLGHLKDRKKAFDGLTGLGLPPGAANWLVDKLMSS